MQSFNVRSSMAGFIILPGIWFLLGWLFVWSEITKPTSGSWKGIIISFSGAILWIIWLRGFRVQIIGDIFEYRNGIYQKRFCKLENIQRYEVKWIEWKVLWRHLKVPRGVVTIRNQEPILINIKPFRRDDLAALRAILPGKKKI